MPAPKQTSARERFAQTADLQDQRRERIMAAAAEGMSENLTRISMWLDKMLEDERKLNQQFNGLDPHKLKEFYFGGFELERVRWLRLSPVTFEIGLTNSKAEVEGMKGFRDLVRACASPDIDMNIIVRHCPEWASPMVEINFEKPFDHNGPYKNLLAKPAATTAPKP